MTDYTLEPMHRRAVMLLALATGCAGTARGPTEPAALDEPGDIPMAGHTRPAARGATSAQPETTARGTATPRAEIPTDVAGKIPRTDLIDVLDKGPGQFLVGIEVSPVFEGARFAGWEIVRFEPADARLGSAPLGPGDVVHSVNARSIARPRQLQTAWDELRAAKALVIEGVRDGRPFALRYDIAP